MGLFFSKNKDQDQQYAPTGKVIAFINQKGGVGKTTMAFNTAHALAKAGKRVLCLDMDPQSNLSLLFGHDSSEDHGPHLFHLLINSVRELRALHCPALLSNIMISRDGVDVIPSGQELSGFELSVAGISAPRQLILKRFLEKNQLLHAYDYVVIDCPPTLGLLVVNILCASSGVIVPFRPDEFSKKGLGHFYQVLEDIDDMGLTEVPKVVAHVPNLVDQRRKQEAGDLETIRKDLQDSLGGAPVTAPFFNRAQLVKSQAQRKSVFDFTGKEFEPLQGQFNELADLIQELPQ